jgi:hypothetical protein
MALQFAEPLRSHPLNERQPDLREHPPQPGRHHFFLLVPSHGPKKRLDPQFFIKQLQLLLSEKVLLVLEIRLADGKKGIYHDFAVGPGRHVVDHCQAFPEPAYPDLVFIEVFVFGLAGELHC